MNQVYTIAAMDLSDHSAPASLLDEQPTTRQSGGTGLSASALREEIWQEVAHWQCGGTALTFNAALPVIAPTLQSLPLRSLLALDGAAFIAAAYHTLLGRPPDQTGFTQLTTEMARGRTKLDILRGIQGSGEARQRGERLRGLDMRYFAQRLGRPPISLMRFGRRVLRAPDGGRPSDGSRSSSRASADSCPPDLEQRLAEQQAALRLITARLAALQAAQEELGRKTLAALAEQDRLLRICTNRDMAAARQTTAAEDELVTAASSLSDELGALSRRLAAIERNGALPLQSEPARLS